MSTGTERIPNVGRSRARVAAAAPPGFSSWTAPTEPVGIQQTRSRRTRRTVDLSPATHRALDIWQRQAADRLGLARVTGQEVLTALIDQLLADPQLAARITRAIRARR